MFRSDLEGLKCSTGCPACEASHEGGGGTESSCIDSLQTHANGKHCRPSKAMSHHLRGQGESTSSVQQLQQQPRSSRGTPRNYSRHRQEKMILTLHMISRSRRRTGSRRLATVDLRRFLVCQARENEQRASSSVCRCRLRSIIATISGRVHRELCTDVHTRRPGRRTDTLERFNTDVIGRDPRPPLHALDTFHTCPWTDEAQEEPGNGGQDDVRLSVMDG